MPSPRANIFADIFAYCWKCKKLKYRLKFTPNVERLIATWAFEFQLTIFKKEIYIYITIRSFESNLQISFRKFDCLGKGRGERRELQSIPFIFQQKFRPTKNDKRQRLDRYIKQRFLPRVESYPTKLIHLVLTSKPAANDFDFVSQNNLPRIFPSRETFDFSSLEKRPPFITALRIRAISSMRR